MFALVNLSRLNLAGTMLGPEQGRRLDQRLRLDTLAVNASAAASVAADNTPPTPGDPTTCSAQQPTPRQKGLPHQQQQQQQQQQRELDSCGSRNGSGNGGEPGRKCISRPTSVPDHRLPEIRDKVDKKESSPKSHAAMIGMDALLLVKVPSPCAHYPCSRCVGWPREIFAAAFISYI